MRLPAVLLTVLALPLAAWANCVTLDVSSWTAKQREYAQQVCSTDAAQPCTLQVANPATPTYTLCAQSANLSGFSTATLKSEAETARVADVAAQSQAVTDAGSLVTELSTNDLCNAALSDITARIDTVKSSLDAEINGITTLVLAKPVLLDMNTAYAAAFKKVARCLVAFRKTLN